MQCITFDNGPIHVASTADYTNFFAVAHCTIPVLQNAALARGSAQTRGQQRHVQEEALQRQDVQLARGQEELATEIRQREEQLRTLHQRKAALDDQRLSIAQQRSRIRQVHSCSVMHIRYSGDNKFQGLHGLCKFPWSQG